MKQFFTTVLLVCILPGFGNLLHAQNDTMYFNILSYGKYAAADKQDAKFYRVPIIKEGDKYKLEDYYISGSLYMSTYVNSPDSMLYDGYTTYYYENGRKKEYGNYVKGIQVGQWKLKYEDTDRVWAVTTYLYGDTERMLKSYYRSGKLKREQYVVKKRGNYHVSGVCFEENGAERKFTEFGKFPEPTFDINKFLANNLHYPEYAAEKGIQGRVYVQFVVQANGKIDKLKVIKQDVDQSLIDEAIRVVSIMPEWLPGKLDDVPTEMYMKLPIAFLLGGVR